MLIVKPYGRSATDFDSNGTLRRALWRRPRYTEAQGIREFAEHHPELLVAQWISTIDKIASKPRANAKPTKEQRALRDKLGQAAWKILKERIPPERVVELRKVWWRKIHPYGDTDDNRSSGREKGRWYARFAGGAEPCDIGIREAAGIARRMEEHLHRQEHRIDRGRQNKRKGRIASRAESIVGNVVDPIDRLPRQVWTSADRIRYAEAGNVAAEIHRAAKEREETGQTGRRVNPDVAATALFAHHGKLFRGADGQPMGVAEAQEQEPDLFALHMAVRETYRRILKNHGKGRREHGTRRRRVSDLLPEDMTALFRLVDFMRRNRELGALVRLGKLIHYQAALAGTEPEGDTGTGDEPVRVIDRWPDAGELEASRYRTSSGQSEIKRNEAFVRVWHGVVALAQRTLTGWAGPDGNIGRDIFGSDRIRRAVGDGYDEDACRERLRLLFGSRAQQFYQEADGRDILRFALEGWAELRNKSFHFVGRGGFARAMRSVPEIQNDDVQEVVFKLLETDNANRCARLIEALRAAHIEFCFGREQLEALFNALREGGPASAPLPRLRRILARAGHAWRRREYRLRLPAAENRREMDANPRRLARYVMLKILYERAFPAWLETRNAETLNGWITRASDRATAAAKSINSDPDAAARMADRISLQNGEGIGTFVDRLAALTATEYRVQRGYASDPESARSQAKHLESLRCDVVAQAFDSYLEEAELSWTLADPTERPLPEERLTDLTGMDSLLPGGAEKQAEEWHAALYFLVHLVPVEAVGGLRHQLRKLSVLEPGPSEDVAAVERIFDLYLDSHDAKFEGGEQASGARALKGLFESEALFRRVCPEGSAGTGSHVPWRGLREMLRYGRGEPRLMEAFRQHPVSVANVDEVEGLEAMPPDGGDSFVARAHAQREELHAKWERSKRRFSQGDRAAYRDALETVVAHRHRANHVRLVNHAQLHRLAMAVLARMADYAGLWERDIYFVTLALIQIAGVGPNDALAESELSHLKKGQIVGALRGGGTKNQQVKAEIKTELRRLFGADFLDGNTGSTSIRNRLAHFNILNPNEDTPFNLTALVNDTRTLMGYDRKLKNAVSRSVIELLARQGLDLEWESRGHRLTDATVRSRNAIHLGGMKVGGNLITEELHGSAFVAMAAGLFAGGVAPAEAGPSGKARAKGQDRSPNLAAKGSRRSDALPTVGQRVQGCCPTRRRRRVA